MSAKRSPVVFPDWDHPPDIQPGDTLRYVVGHADRFGDLTYHVRGIVDGLIVARRWLEFKRRWSYEIVEWEQIFVWAHYGVLTIEKRKEKGNRA